MTEQRVPARASGSEDRSDAIVVSFDARWHEALIAKAFSAVIRRRIPASYTPTWLYFHVNVPKSAICARAKIAAVEYIPTRLVHRFKSDLCLDETEIDAYCGRRREVGIYRLADIELAAVDVSAGELQRHLVYVPPQSFMFLSHGAKAIIDRACKFRGGVRGRR